MSKTALYYFSATGNSLAVARHLAKVLDIGDPISVPGLLVNEYPYSDTSQAKAVGFVFPVQRATIPEMLRGFIQSMPIDPDCYYFAVSTYSFLGSNEFWDIDELLASKGAALNYAANVRMMGNIGLKQPSDATIKRRLEHMERSVDEIATAVAYRQESFFPRSNKLLGWAVKSFTDLRRKNIVFRIDKRCKKCGICAQVCPAQNIHLPAKGSQAVAPIRSDKCEACLACVHWCPSAAISTSTRLHVSYHNPTVSPAELHSSILDSGLSDPAIKIVGEQGDAGEANSAMKQEGSVKTKRDVRTKSLEDACKAGRDAEPKNLDDSLGAERNAELAAALREDLCAPHDIDAWLKSSNENEQAASPLLNQAYPEHSLESAPSDMSDADIVEALSSLES